MPGRWRGGVSASGEPLGRAGRIVRNGRLTSIFRAPAGGMVHIPTQGPIEAYARYSVNLGSKMRFAINRNGRLKGTVIGIFHIMTNGLFTSSFNRKIAIADENFENGKITEEQCKLKKMRAAADYFNYLQKIGYYDENSVSTEMHYFANKLGVEYDDSIELEEPENGRTR